MHQGNHCLRYPAASGLAWGELLDLLAKPQLQAVNTLRAFPSVSHVQVFGERVHLLIEQAERDLPLLEAELKAENIYLSNVRQVTPGLEDVFVAKLDSRTADKATTKLGKNPIAESFFRVANQQSKDERAKLAQNQQSSERSSHTINNQQSSAVSVSGLTKIFGSGAAAFTAVDGISFNVREGQIYGFLG
jgi:hypothetical protein